jgi:RNA polymerase sigma-70 factor (ECF subfamily)
MSVTLDETLRAAAEGDQQAWRLIVEAYSGRVYGLVYRQCGDAELSEEITQATFVKVVSHLGAYRELGRFEAWLFRIAVNRLRDEMRRRKRQAVSMDFESVPPEAVGRVVPGPQPHAAIQQRERVEALQRAIAKLNEADRQLIHLRYTAELSFAQIAQTLGQPLGTVLARGHRALKKLRDMLDRDEMAE